MEVLGWRSDAELVEGVRRGEDFAFGRLFERWFGRVLSIAQDILGDPQAAAEVATDTFHALWFHLDRLEDAEGFGAWAVETSRTFAHERLGAPTVDDRERNPPVPLLTSAPDAAAAVAVALVARGLPAGAGLGEALHGAGLAGAVNAPFAPPAAVGVASPTPAGFAGAAPPGPAPAGFAGAAPPGPYAPPVGFAGTPGSGSILGAGMGSVAEAATAMPAALGAFGDDATSPFRSHRYEPPPRGSLLRSPQVLAGAAAVVLLIVAGALLLLTRGGGDDLDTAADVATTLPPDTTPAAPLVSAPDSSASSATAVTEPTSSSSTEATTTSTTGASTTSRRVTTTRATTSTTRVTATTATTASTTATTATSVTPTTPTTASTTSSSESTTSSTSVTRTTPSTRSTTSSSTSSSVEPKPVILTFTVTAGRSTCPVGAAKLQPYSASWTSSNAETSSLAVNGVTYDGKGQGTKAFCALKGASVGLTVTGPGGKASMSRTTP